MAANISLDSSAIPATENTGRSLADTLKMITQEIILQYKEDDRPWIIGFSGGKDSTTLLQLVFYALASLPKEELHKEVHVLCNDTLVENPAVVRFIDDTLDKIRIAGERLNFPMKVVKVTPTLADSFWVNLIGKGYPSPNRFFRWCTERLKINPTNEYIKKVTDDGEAIILLGTRKAESSNRAQSMKLYERKGQRLRRHSLPGVYVFAPIANLADNDIWSYLLSVKSPWKGDNRKLFTLYRNASGGECPLVIDTSTPSCGNSRFGCWVCTVVDEDKSMEGLIETGETWMEPMLDMRDWLREIRNDATMRQTWRRDLSEGMGPFTRDARAEILKRLLTVQRETGLSLISDEELSAIQWIWHHDFHDAPVVAEIYKEVFGKEVLVVRDEIVKRRKEERDLLEQICAEEGVPPELIEQLVQIEKDKSGLMRRHGLYQDIDMALKKYLKRNPEDASVEDSST
ncbi:MAG: DNA phosphorothioation system sulfurtransferase DndC [Acidobacteria bacterium]|nr:DNA phosphorothioation system sulfurtransferase DndC [Acidobacteriota bacterium]